MIKWLPWILFGATLVALVYSFVLLLNAGSELGDARSEAERLRARSDLALLIIRADWLGRSADDVVRLSEKASQEEVLTGVNRNLHEIGDLVFETRSGVVKDVRYID